MGLNNTSMQEADYIKAINQADADLKVDESLTVKQLKAIYDGQENAKKLAEVEARMKNLEAEQKNFEGEVESLKVSHDALSAENKSLEEAYAELQKAGQEEEVKAKAGVKGPTVKIGKQLYRTTGKAITLRRDGAISEIAAKDLVKDQDLCKSLVMNQSGFLVKIELENE